MEIAQAIVNVPSYRYNPYNTERRDSGDGRALAPKALDEGSYLGVGEGAPWATGAGL